jgi:glycosyltransferase involved in cell wall biosynthesis
MVSREIKAALAETGIAWDDSGELALHVTPPHLFEPLPDVPNVLLTMFEADQIPADQVATANRADLVLVPCLHNRTVLRWAGCRRPLAVVPLGLATEHRAAIPDRPVWPVDVLWVGQASIRKGWDLVRSAWTRAFPGRDDVRLTLKTVPTAGASYGFVTQTGRVRVLAEAWSDAAMADLYRSAHVFVFPSRGEGWGLPVLEAMAAECLVLAPAITGLAEFFDASVGWPLPWARRLAQYGTAVQAYEADADALTVLLRASVTAIAATRPLRQRARLRALTYTWDRTALAIRAAVARWQDTRSPAMGVA